MWAVGKEANFQHGGNRWAAKCLKRGAKYSNLFKCFLLAIPGSKVRLIVEYIAKFYYDEIYN